MSAIPVPTVNINALYTNTTSGTDADPQVMDNAIIDIVSTINANATEQNNNTAAAVLPHADGSVTTAKLADLSVTTAKMAASAVTTAKLADANVTTAKIADSNVTLAKMADASVGTAELVDLSVTTAKIAIGAVGVAQLSPAAAVNETVNNALIVALKADVAQRGINILSAPYNVSSDGVTNNRVAIQAAIDATPAGGTLIIPPSTNGYYMKNASALDTEILLITKPINIIGYGYYSHFVVDDAVPSTCDLIRISPNMTYSSEMNSIQGIRMHSQTGVQAGRHAINLDITNSGQYLSRMNICKNELYNTNGYSIYLTNPTNVDGLFCSAIEKNYMESGINLYRVGDSIKISENTITKYHGIDVSLIAGAKEMVISYNNITARSGIIVRKGNSVKILYNNVEATYSDMTLPNNALIDIDGSDETTNMYGIDVVGNDLTYTSAATTPNDGIRVANARAVLLDRNFLSHNNGQMIRITSAAENTHIGYNLYSCPQPDGTGFITDGGTNTVRTMVHKSNPSTGLDIVWQDVADTVNREGTVSITDKTLAHNLESSSTSTNGILRFLWPQAFASAIKYALKVGRRTTGGGIDSEADIVYITSTRWGFGQTGFNHYALDDGRVTKVFTQSLIPTTGTHTKGDRCYTTDPVAAGKIGWVCTVSGTPGTWKAWGVIDA